VPKLIAIIDDEVEMEFLYTMMMEDAILSGQVTVQFFSDARLFMEWFSSNLPDLILSDISMPHVSGIQLGRYVQQAERGTPIFFVSGYDEQDYSTIMSELGICKFLTKPLDYDKVRVLIETELNLTSSNG